jgi:hypothetical protein
MFLSALLVPLSRGVLRRLLVSPDTVPRWHRDLVKHRHARVSVNRGAGVRVLALLGVKVAPSTVWKILKADGVDPAPRWATVRWADFLRSQAEAILAMDFVETVTLTGQRQYILATIHHAGRRVRILGTTPPMPGSRKLSAIC